MGGVEGSGEGADVGSKEGSGVGNAVGCDLTEGMLVGSADTKFVGDRVGCVEGGSVSGTVGRISGLVGCWVGTIC